MALKRNHRAIRSFLAIRLVVVRKSVVSAAFGPLHEEYRGFRRRRGVDFSERDDGRRWLRTTRCERMPA